MNMLKTPSLILIACLMVFLAFWFFSSGPETAESDLQPDTPSAVVQEEELATDSMVSMVLAHERVVAVPVAEVEQAQPGAGADMPVEEEPATGVIFGNILDGEDVRYDKGRVLVYEDGNFGEPLLELALEGSSMQFRCELPSEKAYRLVVDPRSLEGDYTPALARSRKRQKEERGKVLSARELSYYTLAYVYLKGGEQRQQDVWVGLPTRASGRLLAADGSPMAGALASLSGLDKIIVGAGGRCPTGEDGEFTFEDVYPGEYRLTFSRAEAWAPPAPMDIQMLSGGEQWLGDFRAGGGARSITGRVLDQDGLPFPGLSILCFSNAPVKEGVAPHNFTSALGRAVTGADGSFVLEGLPNLPVKVSMTPNFEPNLVRGPGHPAMWEPSIEVDLSRGAGHLDLGTHTVHESRPFVLSGTLVIDEGWLASRGGKLGGLKATVSKIKGATLPEGIRRVSLRRKPVTFDFDAGTFQCEVETPMTEVEVRFKLKGHEDLVFKVLPEAFGSWSREIRVPADF